MDDAKQVEPNWEEHKALCTNRFAELDVRVDEKLWLEIAGLYDRITIVCDHTLNHVLEGAKDTAKPKPLSLPKWAQDDQPYGLSLYLTGDEKIAQLNDQFRGKNKPTNVLTFPATRCDLADEQIAFSGEDNPIFLGDIVLSLDTLHREAVEQNKSVADHFTHLLIHGILHSFGFDHGGDEEAAMMEHTEIELLEALRISNPYGGEDQT